MKHKHMLLLLLIVITLGYIWMPAYAKSRDDVKAAIAQEPYYSFNPVPEQLSQLLDQVHQTETAKAMDTSNSLTVPERSITQYHVKKGDTLYRIAMTYHTSVEALMVENQIHNPRTLQIGQELIIPIVKNEQVDTASRSLTKNIMSPYHAVIEATLTAYTAGVESTGKTPDHPEYGITYSGLRAKEGRTVAVDPDLIPLGSKIYIEGVGIRTAEDIGSAIQGARIDVFINDLEEALEFGVKKHKKVYILSVPDEE